MQHINLFDDTICAIATPSGSGALGIVRLSGSKAFGIASTLIPGRNFSEIPANTIHFGRVKNDDVTVDEVLVSTFKAPASFTGEDSVEITCHGSSYILQQVIDLCTKHGARLADPGEFTQRAFLNGKMDLSQAEAVADLIASQSQAEHKMAMTQMRGQFSSEIKKLKDELTHFASLIELELDFGEEDVEFADRGQLTALIDKILGYINKLVASFSVGNAIKNGVPVAIVGKPNAGKSTLLNTLLNEDRAIVSDIAGTTRDTIEDEVTIGGVRFRFIDTAGIRDTSDVIESMGVERSRKIAAQAAIVIYLFEVTETDQNELKTLIAELEKVVEPNAGKLIIVQNKIDKESESKEIEYQIFKHPYIKLSAKTSDGVDALLDQLTNWISEGQVNTGDVIVSNTRHKVALEKTGASLSAAKTSLEDGISGDLVAMDIRQALFHLGEITGEISTEDLLGNIFSKFCIGK